MDDHGGLDGGKSVNKTYGAARRSLLPASGDCVLLGDRLNDRAGVASLKFSRSHWSLGIVEKSNDIPLDIIESKGRWNTASFIHSFMKIVVHWEIVDSTKRRFIHRAVLGSEESPRRLEKLHIEKFERQVGNGGTAGRLLGRWLERGGCCARKIGSERDSGSEKTVWERNSVRKN